MFLFLSDIFPKVELLDHIVVLFLIFWGTSTCFLQWLHQFSFLQTVHKCSLISASWPMLIICCLSDNSHSNRCEVITHCSFYLYSSDEWILCTHWHLCIFIGKISVQIFCPFFNLVVCAFLLLCEFFTYLYINSSPGSWFAIYSPWGCLFILLMVDGFCCCSDTF